MTKTVVITTRVEPELASGLDQLAVDFDRSRGCLVEQAIARFVAEESQLLALIKEGEADIEAGRTYTHEEVVAMFGVERERRDAA